MTPHEKAKETLDILRADAKEKGTTVTRSGISHSELDFTSFIFNDTELETYSEGGVWKVRHRTLGAKGWTEGIDSLIPVSV